MKKKVAIIGGGTAGLFLAAFLDPTLYSVTIFEKKASLGRKFLVAGDGGFNLTHSEELSLFKTRYTPPSFLIKALNHFTNADLRSWFLDLGVPTFVGSSGRVFPEKGIKPIEVLKSIQAQLIKSKVYLEFNKTFTGWDKGQDLVFNSVECVKTDYTVFALGGASWKVTGSDAAWMSVFKEKGIATVPFRSSNCAYKIKWPEKFIERHEGAPLKNISITIDGKIQKGEAVITKFGLEGNAIYGLSPEIQARFISDNEAIVYVDFKPTTEHSVLLRKLSQSKTNTTTALKDKIKLPPSVIALIKATLPKDDFLDQQVLARSIKCFSLKLLAAAPIDEAISTSGGIALSAVDTNFELKKIKNTFCIGEMLDWNAPTGGYLIQACASMGVYLAE